MRPKTRSEHILDYINSGKSVVLQFGELRRYRRLRAGGQPADDGASITSTGRRWTSPLQPTPKNRDQLVITIEEAHRFLNPEISAQTIFGKIAREMRKYNVTMLVIDQRPSGIDEEVMSQLGTKITCLLDNEKDVDAVLTGVSGKSELKSVLSKLESKQQALIFGHAVPMPVVVKIREYGSAESYKELGPASRRKVHKGPAGRSMGTRK